MLIQLGLLAIWILAIVVQFKLVVLSTSGASRWRWSGLPVASLVSGLPAVLTLLLFVYVYVLGGASNVVQLAGEGSGLHYWSVWFNAWPLLVLANPAALFLALVLLFASRRNVQHWRLVLGRLAGVFASLIANYVVFTLYPTA